MRRTVLSIPLIFLVLFSAVAIVAIECLAEQPLTQAQYLAIIVIDACRPDYFELAEIPNLRFLMANGVTYVRAWLAQLQANSPPSHATVSTGSLPRNQGVIGVRWRDPDTGAVTKLTKAFVGQGMLGETIVASGAASIPQLIKEVDPSAKVLAISSTKFFAAAAMGNKFADYVVYSIRSGNYLVPTGVTGQMPPSQVLNDPALKYHLPISAIEYDTWVMDVTLKMLELECPQVVMINLPVADGVGHDTGGIVAPQAMAEVLTNVDRQIGRLIEAYRKLEIFDQTVFVVTSDHAMVPNTRTVSGDLIKKAIKESGTTALSLGGGTSFNIYLRDQTKSQKAAVNIDALKIPGVDAVYYRANEQDTYYYVPTYFTASRTSQGLNEVYKYLLSTYASPMSPDIAVVLEEYTVSARVREERLGEDPPNTRGGHGGLSWLVQHIPIIIAGPGVKKGYVSDMPARIVDIAPTALSLMGILIRNMDGIILADGMIYSSSDQLNIQVAIAEKLKPLQDTLIAKSEQDLASLGYESRITNYSKVVDSNGAPRGANPGASLQNPVVCYEVGACSMIGQCIQHQPEAEVVTKAQKSRISLEDRHHYLHACWLSQ